jgi:type I restriction enzyme, S subunit
MNAEQLLQHFERISEAPDAIPRLRRFILDLAVRGKLVEQDPSDEPAEELLKRIAVERARLQKLGDHREPRSQVHIKREDLPFSPPTHWQWVRLLDIAHASYGFAFASSKFNTSRVGMPLIRIRDISNLDTEAYYEGDYDPAYLVKAGDYLVGMDGDFNLRQWKGRDGLLNQRVLRLNGWRCGVVSEYVRLPLQTVLSHIHGVTSLTTVKHLSAKQVNGIEIPLPPLAEQHRIIARVDELMGLCDQLEAVRAEREHCRASLVAASLQGLNQSAEDEEIFREHARFTFTNLPRITKREPHIKQLRQTILNLAVRGRLVEQDPSDEPAAELLKRIAAEKARLVKAGEIPRKPPAVRDLSREIECFPKSWEVIALGEVCNMVTSGSRGWAEFYATTGAGFIRAQNIRYGQLKLDDLAYVKLPPNSEGSRTKVERGDLLIVITGAGVTNPALLDQDIGEAYVSQHVGLMRAADKKLSDWLLLCLMSPAGGRDELTQRAYGAGKPGLNLDNIRSLTVPLPPLAEQHRIVAKVDLLMSLCDQLEAKITEAEQDSRRFLEAVLNDALSPAPVEAA